MEAEGTVKELKHFIADKVTRLDLIVWLLVVGFFCGSALVMGGNLQGAFLGASGIIVVMFLIGSSIEMIVECLKNVKGLGTLVGFITNGPEALCLLVGVFITRDVLFAASTPLGSNFMNPLFLVVAALLMKSGLRVLHTYPRYTWVTVSVTVTLAVSFYLLPERIYWFWVAATFIAATSLFVTRPREDPDAQRPSEPLAFSRIWLVPALLMLLAAGYFLDPTVQFAAEHSKARAGIIGFLVLSTLTSWPEFKSTLALLQRNMVLAAILNVTVSNITNLWLAVAGVTWFLL